MDEIDLLKNLKKVIKYTIIILLIMSLINIAFYWDFFEKDIISNLYLLNDILSTERLFAGFILLPEILAYFYFKLKYKKGKVIFKDNDELTREVFEEYPPALCDFLCNRITNAYTDHSATILNLEQKGYVEVSKDSIKVKDENTKILKLHQQYVIDCLKEKTIFDMIKFKQYVAQDALDMNLVYIKKTIKSLPKILMFAVFFGLIALNKKLNSDALMYFIDIYSVAMIIYYMIAIYINNKAEGYDLKSFNYKLTQKGKDVKEKILGLKIYMRDYSLLNERSIEEKELWGNYISYALALKEGKNVEKFVSENERYRNLIYKNRRNKMSDFDDIYNELIMEHSMNSYNKKKLNKHDFCEIGHNPNCGDEITLEIEMDGNVIKDMAFSGHGCAISQASTSIMIDTLKGKSVKEAKEIMETFIGMIKREIKDEDELRKLEDAIAFKNVANMPARVKCALLAWHTLEDILNKQIK